MTQSCVQCGEPFEAKRSTARYCSGNCRARASQGAAPIGLAASAVQDSSSGAVEATEAALRDVGRLDSPLGRQAVFLARRMVNESGSALASLSREWRATLDAATANAQVAEDPVERLRLVVGDRLGGG